MLSFDEFEKEQTSKESQEVHLWANSDDASLDFWFHATGNQAYDGLFSVRIINQCDETESKAFGIPIDAIRNLLAMYDSLLPPKNKQGATTHA